MKTIILSIGETIIIDGSCELVVIATKKGKVRLAFDDEDEQKIQRSTLDSQELQPMMHP